MAANLRDNGVVGKRRTSLCGAQRKSSGCFSSQAALIAESFTPRLRYSGDSIGYQLASPTAGGPAPLIATVLFAQYNSGTPIAINVPATTIISIVATMFRKDYTGRDVSAEYDEKAVDRAT